MMRLVVINSEDIIVHDFGEMEPELANQFFEEALDAIEFKKKLPEVMLKNEIQLHFLTDSFAKMGLLSEDPKAIQLWMRPYIEAELRRIEERKGLLRRVQAKLATEKGKVLDWIKQKAFQSFTKFFQDKLTKK